MYLEFVILIWDYLKTLNTRKVLYEIVIPLIPIITIFFFSEKLNIFREIVNTSIDIIGILLGFSIYNPQNEMYQKLKRKVHFLSGG